MSGANDGERRGGGGASVNKSIIVGNVGMPPEWKHKEGQAPYCVFTVGVSRGRRVGDRYETLWYRVSAWGKQAENAVKYLLKSQQVYVEGRLVVSDWDIDGKRCRYTHELACSDFQMLGDPMDALSREAERLEADAIQKEGSNRS